MQASLDGCAVLSPNAARRRSTRVRVGAAMARAIERAANAALRAVAWCLWPRRRPGSAARVCVYRIGNIGDMICALPAIHAVRRAYPAAHLTLLTSPGRRDAAWTGELLKDLGWLDEVSVYYSDEIDGWRELLEMVRELRKRRFDAWIGMPSALAPFHILLRNLVVARICRVRWAAAPRIGTVRVARRAQSEAIDFDDEVERLLKLVGRLGIEGDDAIFPLALAERHRRRAAKLLAAPALAGRRLVAIAPGAKRPTNRWPVDRFIALGRRLAAGGFGLVIVGGAAERDLCVHVEAAIGSGDAINLAGQCSVPESCAVLARCELLICNDSGAQHLAAAMGVRCVSIFAARDLGLRWRPHGPQHVVFRKWVPCHTCLLEVCPYDNRCVGLVTLEEVAAAAERLLDTSSPRGDAIPDDGRDRFAGAKLRSGI